VINFFNQISRNPPCKNSFKEVPIVLIFRKQLFTIAGPRIIYRLSDKPRLYCRIVLMEEPWPEKKCSVYAGCVRCGV